MSICYADALSPYDNKGEVGMPEFMDQEEEVDRKCKELAELIRNANTCFVITGAGISTSAGIADFRGPKGVWTLEKEGKPADSINFVNARPTVTHASLVELERRGLVQFLVSQNVDGLHPKSGFPLNRLAELHGNVFCEQCERCFRRYYLDDITGQVGRKLTGRSCQGRTTGRSCRGQLRDTVLDWEDDLPEPDLTTSFKYAKNADLVICLGTSLQIVPVGDMPLLTHKIGGKIVTVNLQQTKHEKKVDLKIHAKVDDVMIKVLKYLDIVVPKKEEFFGDVVWESSHPLEEFKPATRKSRKRRGEEVKKEETSLPKEVKTEENGQLKEEIDEKSEESTSEEQSTTVEATSTSPDKTESNGTSISQSEVPVTSKDLTSDQQVTISALPEDNSEALNHSNDLPSESCHDLTALSLTQLST